MLVFSFNLSIRLGALIVRTLVSLPYYLKRVLMIVKFFQMCLWFYNHCGSPNCIISVIHSINKLEWTWHDSHALAEPAWIALVFFSGTWTKNMCLCLLANVRCFYFYCRLYFHCRYKIRSIAVVFVHAVYLFLLFWDEINTVLFLLTCFSYCCGLLCLSRRFSSSDVVLYCLPSHVGFLNFFFLEGLFLTLL